MRERITRALIDSAQAKQRTAAGIEEPIWRAAQLLTERLREGSKVLFCGNGGSAADSQHLAAEFVVRFTYDRRPLSALALTADSSILTATGNDYSFEEIFRRQVLALGQPGDVLVAISTSGRSPNVIAAAEAAQRRGLSVIALTGSAGGELASFADVLCSVPSDVTARIQEVHMTIGHIWCDLVQELLTEEGAVQDVRR